MRFLRLRWFLPLLFLALTAGGVRTAAAQGNAGAASLQIPPGARAEGMGRTFTAIADDAFAPWWNPGGLAFLEGKNASLMHAKLVPGLADDVYFEYASYAQYLPGWGGVALSLTYLNYGKSIRTEPGDPTPRGEFTSFEIAPALALGAQITNNLGVGANLKYIYVDLAPASSSTGNQDGTGSSFGVDLGLLYRVPGAPINVAVAVQNLGPDITIVDEEQGDPLPRTFRVGAAWQVIHQARHSVIVAVDGDKQLLTGPDCTDANGNGKCDTNDSTVPETQPVPNFFEKNLVLMNFGAEYSYNNLLAVRAGYIYDDPGEITDFTYGLGIKYKSLSLDYASIPQFEDLDRVNKFSLSVRF